jgi:BirA family biotin operon repressor/biotin-[acetyl-CoA-carboxylase] ligase
LIHIAARTGSTNADLLAQLRGGEHVSEGTWLVTDRQDAGRGRQGRVWSDGLGNFMGSTVVHRHPSDPPASSLALLVGLTLHEVIAPLVPPPHRPELKWPNDVQIGGAKLAGILLEGEGALSAFGPSPDRDAFATSLARQFVIELERWRNFGVEPLVRRWLAAGHSVGTPLKVGEPAEEPLVGAFAGLTAEGALLLRLADGTTQTIHAGEVRLAGGN